MSNKRIIVALDFDSDTAAVALVEKLDSERCRLKVGQELFSRSGPHLVEKLVQDGFDVFLDLKFHDIPNTVARACMAAAELGVWMINVHASGGRHMLESAREAVAGCAHQPLLTGVTVLTSLSAEDLSTLGMDARPEQQVLRLARLSHAAGLDGVICSAREITPLRTVLPYSFKLVTPGIRPASASAHDQKRTMTPAQAVAAGSDYLVIGRPITQADDPLQVLIRIEAEIQPPLKQSAQGLTEQAD